LLQEEQDRFWMLKALDAAREAQERDEVPIGACLIKDNSLIAVAGNRTRTDCDPTAHAEIIVLRETARAIGNYRLTNSILYSTIEPCPMCAGALVQARVARLVYGAMDERAGAVVSRFQLCDSSLLNHRMEITAGVLEEECKTIIQNFFRKKRQRDF
jgi:tRNA(adenine34) deaminase